MNTAKLKNLPIQIIDGDRSARYPKRKEFQNEGILFLNTTNISDNRLDLSDVNYITREQFSKLGKGKLQPFDIVMTTRGSLGKVALFNHPAHQTGFINAQMLIFRADGKMIDPFFLYYTFCTQSFQGRLKNFASGSAQPQIPMIDLREIEINYPDFPIQRRIADILSAYDDMIEVNTRRIRILEGMAQSLYHEMFGKIDVESMPDGWEIKELQDTDTSIIDGDRGKNYPGKSAFSKDGYCLFLNAGNFKDDRFDYSDNDFITEEKDNLLRKGRLQPNDTVLTTRGTVGKIAFFSQNAPYKKMRINSGMVIIRPVQNSLYWYFLLKSPLLKGKYKSFASGSAQPQLPIKDMNKINVLVPPESIVSRFCEIAEPIATQTEILLIKNANLRKTRDLLLPRLVGGEVPVNGW